MLKHVKKWYFINPLILQKLIWMPTCPILFGVVALTTGFGIYELKSFPR